MPNAHTQAPHISISRLLVHCLLPINRAPLGSLKDQIRHFLRQNSFCFPQVQTSPYMYDKSEDQNNV